MSKQKVTPPADLIVLLNQAAPGLTAKRFEQVLDSVLREKNSSINPKRPLIVSVTSKTDRATALAFPIARWIGSVASRNRVYEVGSDEPVRNQNTYIRKTAGHISELWTHEITAVKEGVPEKELGQEEFRFTATNDAGADSEWSVQQKSRTPWTTPYWIVSAPHAFSADHGDVWNDNVEALILELIDRNRISDADVKTELKVHIAPPSVSTDPVASP